LPVYDTRGIPGGVHRWLLPQEGRSVHGGHERHEREEEYEHPGPMVDLKTVHAISQLHGVVRMMVEDW
jgi:hypothetical protein